MYYAPDVSSTEPTKAFQLIFSRSPLHRYPSDGSAALPLPGALLRQQRGAIRSALSALRGHGPRCALQHRQLRAAHLHDRSRDQSAAGGFRAHLGRCACLPQSHWRSERAGEDHLLCFARALVFICHVWGRISMVVCSASSGWSLWFPEFRRFCAKTWLIAFTELPLRTRNMKYFNSSLVVLSTGVKFWRGDFTDTALPLRHDISRLDLWWLHKCRNTLPHLASSSWAKDGTRKDGQLHQWLASSDRSICRKNGPIKPGASPLCLGNGLVRALGISSNPLFGKCLILQGTAGDPKWALTAVVYFLTGACSTCWRVVIIKARTLVTVAQQINSISSINLTGKLSMQFDRKLW